MDDAVDWTVDKAKSGASTVADIIVKAGEKTCELVTHPYTQVAAAGAASYPSGEAQAASGAVRTGTVACGALFPPPSEGMPEIPSSPAPSAPWRSAIPLTAFQKIAPATAPVAVAPAIPPGSIAAFDPKAGGFRIAVPAGLSGFAEAAAFTEVGITADPGGARLVSLKTFEQDTGAAKPWYKRPLVLTGIGLGVVALGVGGYALARR